jgi:hypothetical protein
LIDKLFHHKHHDIDNTQKAANNGQSTAKEQQSKEGDIDKLEDDVKEDKKEFNNYIQEDTKLEKEGQTYGGLM